MQKVLTVFALLVVFAGANYAQEVSQKMQVTVTGVYSSRNVSSASKEFFNQQLIERFNHMRRFEVIGMQFSLDDNSATQLINKLIELKKQQIMSDDRYVDADFGVVVIPANQLEQMAKAFYVVIPSITGWKMRVTNYMATMTIAGQTVRKKVTRYTSTVEVQIKIITAEGTLMDTYTRSEEGESVKSEIDAYNDALGDCLDGLELFLRNTEEFKLKSAVRAVLPGGLIVMELGNNLGVKPGYEFAVERTVDLGAGFTQRTITSMVRVKLLGDTGSQARVLWGPVSVNDQLIEAPLAGGRLNLYGGVSLAKNEITSISSGTVTKTFDPQALTIDAGLAFEHEIKYAAVFHMALGMTINELIAGYFDVGGGYSLYLGRLCIEPQILLSALGAGTSLQSGSSASTSFYDFELGGKFNLNIDLQFSQKFKLRLWGGYALYFPTSRGVLYSDGSGSQDVSSSSTVNGVSFNNNIGTYLNYSAPSAGLSFVFRF